MPIETFRKRTYPKAQTARRFPLLVAVLSLVPGAGHLVLGKRKKAVALFAADLGIVLTIFIFRSRAGHLLAYFGYFMAMIPAVIESYALAKGGVTRFSESKGYITTLLLVTGFPALPLLWNSPEFSRQMKIIWSVAVPVLAIFYLSFLSIYGIRFLNHVGF